MSEYSQNQQNPSGIWQHIWVTLIMDGLAQYRLKDYSGAYDTAKLLKSQLPPECKKDCEENFKEIEKIFSLLPVGFNLKNAQERHLFYIHKNLPTPLINLYDQITASLFTHNWINKDFSIHPRKGTASIRCPE